MIHSYSNRSKCPWAWSHENSIILTFINVVAVTTISPSYLLETLVLSNAKFSMNFCRTLCRLGNLKMLSCEGINIDILKVLLQRMRLLSVEWTGFPLEILLSQSIFIGILSGGVLQSAANIVKWDEFGHMLWTYIPRKLLTTTTTTRQSQSEIFRPHKWTFIDNHLFQIKQDECYSSYC